MNKITEKTLFLFDMDGTIYIDDKLIKGTNEFLNYIIKKGGKYLFLTNNSSKSNKAYIDKLKKLNINVSDEDFITSASVTAEYLKENHKDDYLYVLGTKFFKDELLSNNLKVTDDITKDIKCIVVGFDTELTYEKINNACMLLKKDIDFVATNPDLVCPTFYGFMPDCGSICNMIKQATGKTPEFIGKPKPDMILKALSETGRVKDDAIMIGDRIYTDIACGYNAGVDTALVLSGEAGLKDVKESKIKPDYVFEDIFEMYKTFKKGEKVC